MGRIALTGLCLPHCCACPKPGPGFLSHMLWSFFCVQWFEIKNGCSFCLYWWNCLNSLFITVSYKGLDTFLSSLLWLVYVCLMMVFNATFNNISVILWQSVLLVEEIRGPRENRRPVASHRQTLSHNVVHLALIEIRTYISADRHCLHR